MGNTHGHMAPIIGQSRYSLNLGLSSMRVRLTGQDYTGATGQHCRKGFYDGFVGVVLHEEFFVSEPMQPLRIVDACAAI